jgi:hypothetical protein
MTQEEIMKKRKPVAKQNHPHIGAVCADDLGLKAGFMKDKNGDVTFSPIVGWASVANYSRIKSRAMTPLVLDDNSFPTLASKNNFPDFVGVFDKSVSAAEAKRKFQSGRAIE